MVKWIHNQRTTFSLQENRDYRIDVSFLVASEEGGNRIVATVYVVQFKSGCFNKVNMVSLCCLTGPGT